MSAAIKDILSLSVAERILLVEEIWDSIEAESGQVAATLTPVQLAEARQRIHIYQQNKSQAITWEQAKASILNES